MGCFTCAMITSDLGQNHRQGGVYIEMNSQASILKLYNRRLFFCFNQLMIGMQSPTLVLN